MAQKCQSSFRQPKKDVTFKLASSSHAVLKYVSPVCKQLYQFQSLKQFTIRRLMLRRDLQLPLTQEFSTQGRKEADCSLSTEDSSSPRNHPANNQAKSSIKKNKEKSQLCKKFMEQGFCPYQKKCKFAHGSQELRKDQQFNSKYKTKECGVFLEGGCCMYGERCNFIHQRPVTHCHPVVGDSTFQQIKAEGRLQSRLLSLLVGG